MCVVELNVSTLPCRHRWYHLSNPCSPSNNLVNCPAKLGLSGWEIKCSFCPYCDGSSIDESEYKLVGNDRSPSIGGLSRSSSMAYVGSALSSQRREGRGSRRCNLVRTDNSGSEWILARDTGEKNRAQLNRLDQYLSMQLDRNLGTSTWKSDPICDEERGSISESATSNEVDKLGTKWLMRSKRFLMQTFVCIESRNKDC